MTNNHTKKSNHPKFFIKIKNMFQKKITYSKNKNNYHAQALRKSKEKKIEKKGNVNAQEKKKVTTNNVIAKKKKRKEAKKRGNITGNNKEKKWQKEGQSCCLGKREEENKNAT